MLARLAIVAICGLVPGVAVAAPEAAKPADDTHTVVRGPLKLELELDGVLEAAKIWPVEVKLKAWQSQGLKIIDPIEQGRTVHKGDSLITFDTADIDKAIRDAELGAEAARVALELARHELQLLERSVAVDRAAAERSLQYAKLDLDYFAKVSRPLAEKSSAERLKSSRFNLEYAQEELDQLRQMYKEDELTEESEEIILKRQERAVEFARNMVEQADEQHKLAMETTMPRRQKEMEVSLQKTGIEHDRTQATLPLKLQQSRQALTRAENAFKDATEKLQELRADRASLVVRAPADGVVFYGRCERGKWLESSAVAAAMKPEGTVRPNSVFLTIVALKPLFVRCDVNEVSVLRLRDGLTGWFIPAATPHEPLNLTVRTVGRLPVAPGQYDVVADVADPPAALVPGMTGKLKFITYEAADALKVPLAAVKSDAPGRHHVFIKTDQGFQRRDIRLGQRTGTDAEILDGLKEGDVIHAKGEPK